MPEDEHPSEEILRHFVAGTSSRDEGRRITLHLLAGCAACSGRIRGLLRPEIPGRAYATVWSRLQSLPLSGAGALVGADSAAHALLAELDAEPEPRQEMLARNSRRYRSPDLALLLAERSFELRYQDPRRLLRAAQLAVAISENLHANDPEESYRLADVRALCAVRLSNALRITGDLSAADRAMAEALAALREGTGNAALRAMIYDRLGALRTWQCRYEAAIQAYERAAEIFRDLGRPQDLAGVLVGQAIAILSMGDPEGALELLLEALPKIEGGSNPRLTLAACHAVVSCQIDAGRIEDASFKWIELRFLYEQIGDPLLRLREKWLEGKLMIAQGLIPTGIRLLETTRAAYRKHGLFYDAAVIALEIAQGHLRLGRRDRVRALLSEVVPIFQSLDLNKDILGAFVLLRRASQEADQPWLSFETSRK